MLAEPLPTAGPTRKCVLRSEAPAYFPAQSLFVTADGGRKGRGWSRRAARSASGRALPRACSSAFRFWAIHPSTQGRTPLLVRPGPHRGSCSRRKTGILTRGGTKTREKAGRAFVGLLPSSRLPRSGHPGTEARSGWVKPGRRGSRPDGRRPSPGGTEEAGGGTARGRGAGVGRGERGPPGMPRGTRLPPVGGAGGGGRKWAKPASPSTACTSGASSRALGFL